jgi:hypothetical protein
VDLGVDNTLWWRVGRTSGVHVFFVLLADLRMRNCCWIQGLVVDVSLSRRRFQNECNEIIGSSIDCISEIIQVGCMVSFFIIALNSIIQKL